MNSKTVKRIRQAAGYRPGTPAQYEKPELHHIAHMPKFETHERIITEMGPRGVKLKRTVTKIRYGADGRTPLKPIWAQVDAPAAEGEEPRKVLVPQTEFIPITKPVRLKQGTPKAIYRLLKKIERTVGLDNAYGQLAAEMEVLA